MKYTYQSFENWASKPSEGIFPTRKLFETLLQKKNQLVSNNDTQKIHTWLQKKIHKLDNSHSQTSKLL